ncbi:MAG: iron ABC transporter permease [Clostridiales bacterium]
MKKKIIIGTLITLIIMLAATCIGSQMISPVHTLSILGNKMFHLPLNPNVTTNEIAIIWELRLPRVLLAFLVGGSLAASGTVVQSILRNPLASPFTLGVSSGASLGAGIVIISGVSLAGLGMFTLPIVGLLFGLLTVIGSVVLAGKIDSNLSNNTIVLIGMVFSLFINAILMSLTAFFRENMEAIVLWQMGSFALKGWQFVLGILPFFCVGIIGLMFYVREMDIMTFGEEQAISAGVETEKVKWILLALTAVLTGSAVAFAGVIGFIDLIAPHVVRKFFGSAHRYVLPMSIIFGGIFMIVADVIARTVIPSAEIPVGVISALIGAPFFAYVFFKKEKSIDK